jgi:trk system potassium uptake protein TrkH
MSNIFDRSQVYNVGLEGALLTASPAFYFILSQINPAGSDFIINLILITAATLLNIICALTIYRMPLVGKFSGTTAIIIAYITAFPFLLINPFYALLANVITAIYLYLILANRDTVHIKSSSKKRSLQRLTAGLLTFTVIIAVFFLFRNYSGMIPQMVISISFLILQLILLHWSYYSKEIYVITAAMINIFIAIILWIFSVEHLLTYVFILHLIISAIFIAQAEPHKTSEHHWWDTFLFHPARMLLSTFILLCLTGTILLLIPSSFSGTGKIAFIDAAFTSVSAVCVTGLITLDTPNDFSLFGQMIILILIQLGGLGIMSITTVALHVMGQRLSLKHEVVLSSITEKDQKGIVSSLALILKYTFTLELIGFILLSAFFMINGEPFSGAVWRGLFTSVSAFCNAGFALQSDSLMGYNTQPLILTVVAGLIFAGGMAPAICLSIRDWVRGRQITITARLALVTTFILIISGSLLILIFEWNGILEGMAFTDKITNAFFQSVTLRTAGFNSVDITQIANPTFIIMVIFMFIGGSPGGSRRY